MNRTITLSEREYIELLSERYFAEALRQAGVDNWPGYDYAMEILEVMLLDVDNVE